MRTKLFLLILATFMAIHVFTPQKSAAQLSGYTRGAIYGLGDQYDITHSFGELGLLADYSRDQVKLVADVRFLSGIRFNERFSDFRINEAYASYQSKRADISLGNQIVKWGRADGFNPTANLHSSDYFFLSSDPDDQLFGTFMLRARVRLLSQLELDVIGIPFYHPSRYRYDLFDFGENAVFADAIMPEVSFNNAALAVRLNAELPSLGFSVSAFRGVDPFYGFNLTGVDWSGGAPMISYAAKPYKKTSLGADFSIPVSTFILRGEMAWNTTDRSPVDIHIPSDHLHYVAALESQFAGITAILQYIGKYDLNFVPLVEPILINSADPLELMDYSSKMILFESERYNRNVFNLTEEMNHGLSLTLTRSFGYDLMMAELTGYYLITTKEYLVRPKITMNLADGLNLAVGAQFMDGPDASVFSYAGRIMTGVFVELKASF